MYAVVWSVRLLSPVAAWKRWNVCGSVETLERWNVGTFRSTEGQNYMMIDDRVCPVNERELKATSFLPGIMV